MCIRDSAVYADLGVLPGPGVARKVKSARVVDAAAHDRSGARVPSPQNGRQRDDARTLAELVVHRHAEQVKPFHRRTSALESGPVNRSVSETASPVPYLMPYLRAAERH